eukprot:1150725-Pelagomonas_calceolata.AAC.5
MVSTPPSSEKDLLRGAQGGKTLNGGSTETKEDQQKQRSDTGRGRRKAKALDGGSTKAKEPKKLCRRAVSAKMVNEHNGIV